MVFLFIPSKICEHNYRAVGSNTPEKSARKRANYLRNKCKKAIQETELQDHIFNYINWIDEVEVSPAYEEALNSLNNLYQMNDEFCADIRGSTEAALRYIANVGGRDSIDLEEGVNYPLKELAFLTAVPRIYDRCEKFVYVYHRPWPALDKYFNGSYDGILRPYLGYFVLE